MFVRGQLKLANHKILFIIYFIRKIGKWKVENIKLKHDERKEARWHIYKKIACITSQMLPDGVVYLNLLIHGLSFQVICSVHRRIIVPTDRKEEEMRMVSAVSGFTITTSSSSSSSSTSTSTSSFFLSIRQQQQQDYQYRKKKKRTPSLLFLSPPLSSHNDYDVKNNNDNDLQYVNDGISIAISIEYCPGCRWMTKSFWIATELLQKYSDEQKNDSDYNDDVNVNVDDGSSSSVVIINSIKIIPSFSGTFKITGRRATSTSSSSDTDITTTQSKNNNNNNTVVLWDRTVDDGFPPIDLIELNTRIKKYYHSLPNHEKIISENDNDEVEVEAKEEKVADREATNAGLVSVSSADIVIRYCSKQQYLFRAVYYGQELFTTFNDDEITSITLIPMTTTTTTTTSTTTTTTGVQHEEEHEDDNQLEETQLIGRTDSDFTIELLKTTTTSMNNEDKEGDDDEEEIIITEQQQYLLWDASSSSQEETTRKTETTSCKFPEVKILKRLIRDCITPTKSLGHSDDHINSETDSKNSNNKNSNNNEDNGSGVGECIPCNSNKEEKNDEDENEIDDDDDDDDDEDEEDNADAEADARRFFGVM